MGDVALPALAHARFGPAGYGALLGPVPFFLVAGALVAAAVLFGLTQREFRTFGAAEDAGSQDVPQADGSQAAEGSRK